MCIVSPCNPECDDKLSLPIYYYYETFWTHTEQQIEHWVSYNYISRRKTFQHSQHRKGNYVNV